MDKEEIIKNIASRTGGDIYLGVVGAVRTGKSTFIKKVIETLVVPNIKDEYERKRALDEIPQSASGKTIMTIEPKFVPNTAAKVNIDDFDCNIRLIDCVGSLITFSVPSSAASIKGIASSYQGHLTILGPFSSSAPLAFLIK